jgi:aldehyde:ferredoxin oxidoreductase
MAFGYHGRTLNINLSNGTIETQSLDREIVRNYIGGSGLSARIIYDTTLPTTSALSPQNPLIFMTGPFTGTNIPTSGRHSVAAKSPLTNIWGESDVGGSWGFGLKRAGYDGIIVTGKAEKPVWLLIDDDNAQIRDASSLWGLDTYNVDTVLKNEIDERVSIASIGPAGEKLVRFAAIMHDGKNARAAGRCGLGAVMGSKLLKAVVVTGSGKKLEVADKKGLEAAVKKIVPVMVKKSEWLRKYGTSGSVEELEAMGDLPIRNWRQRSWEGGSKKISGQRLRETIYRGNYFCKTCVIGCGKEVRVTEGRYKGVDGAAAEHETVGMLGSLCMIDNLESISLASQLSNQYGMDTISTGGAIAFAMEAYEKGIVGKEDTDGLELSWGDADAVVEMVRRIGRRNGKFAWLLGEGVRRASREIGGKSEEFAIHVKGLELPAHDPRAFGSLALGYTTSNRGACHLQAYSHPLEGWIAMPELGYSSCLDPHSDEGKAPMVAAMQDLMCMFDSLKLCKFSLFGGIKVKNLVEFLNYITDFDMDLKTFMKTGERIFTLKRLYNCRCGVRRKDDTLPARILTRRSDRDYIPQIGRMLLEYYKHRGWSEQGVPLGDKVREVGLENV